MPLSYIARLLARRGDHQIAYDDTPIEIHAEDLVSRLADGAVIVDEDGVAHRRMALAQAFLDRPRTEMIGVFLAVLELVRQGRIRVFQRAADAPIVVELNEDESIVPPVAEHRTGGTPVPPV
jgi:chromatin segregation and condensation protein Rec8/ScpA/Scc1 (kleisin family)